MKISEVKPEYVFQKLGLEQDVCAVDFKRHMFIGLEGQTVGAVQQLISRANTEKSIKFYQIETAAE